jgi:AcrR family transcriptional regulator
LESIAREILVEEGLSGFSIEKIAGRSGYSRPTVYQHFASRAEALERVARHSIEVCNDLIDGGLRVNGSPRERALGLVVGFEQFARFHPDCFNVTEFIGFPWVMRALSPGAQTAYVSMVEGYTRAFDAVFREALDGGLVRLAGNLTTRHLVFHTIASVFGILSSTVKNRLIFRFSDHADPWLEGRQAIHALWDGFGFAPRSTDCDYEAVYSQVLKRYFPDYWLRAQTEELAREVHLPEPARASGG